MDFDASRSLQGLRLGQGGLILCGNTGVAYQGHENGPFAILCITNKRPFVSECKCGLCGAVQYKALGSLTLSAISELSQTIARACYIRCAGAP